MIGALILLAQLSVTATVPDTVAMGEIVDVSVRVVAPGRRTPEIAPPTFRPFLLVRMARSERLERGAAGAMQTVVDVRYTISPTREGTYELPPITVSSGGTVARSGPVRLVVRRTPVRGREAPSVVTRSRLDTSQVVNFRALATPDTVYVGQQVSYQFAAFVELRVRNRLRRMEGTAPEMRGLLAYDSPTQGSGRPTRVVNGREYEAHVYHRPVFAIAPGRHVIPPARLMYSLPLSYSFFSREESFELSTDSTIVVAIEPPTEGRPGDWTGAVGDLRVNATIDTAGARVGDPLALRVRVSGTGNVKLFPRPVVNVPWARTVSGTESVVIERDLEVVRGSKTFEFLLTPLEEGDVVVPSIRYVFFDPAQREYRSAETTPLGISVAPGALVAMDTIPGAPERLALRTQYRGAVARPFYERVPPWSATVLLLAPLPALAIAAAGRRRTARREASAAVRLRGYARSPRRRDRLRDIRRTFVQAIGERLGVPALGLAEPVALERAVRLAGVSDGTARRACELLTRLNEAAFGDQADDAPEAAESAYSLYRDVDREARRRPTITARSAYVILPLAALLFTGSAGAASEDEEANIFMRGVEAYERGRADLAQREFANIVARSPRAADAWANLGTSAWEASDTAVAVQGWQRALRLEPLAEDVRHRLTPLSPAGLTTAYVAPVPPQLVAAIALALWFAGCAVATIVAWRRRGGTLGVLSGTLAISAAFAVASGWMDTRLAGRDVVVLGSLTHLRSSASLAGERTATVRTAEVVRVVERRGEWSRLVADDGRSGWTAGTRLLPLERD